MGVFEKETREHHMRTKTSIGVKLISAGIVCLAAFGLAIGSSQAATLPPSLALSFLGHAFFPSQATCFDPADFGRTSNNGSCGTGGIWYVMNPPVTSTGQRAVVVTGSSGISSPSTANAVVANRLGQLLRQSGTKNLPGGIGGGNPTPTTLSPTLQISADEYLELDFFLMPSGSVNSVIY
jgi:hypothetical protein